MPFYGEIPAHQVDPTEPFPFDTDATICDWCAGERGWQPIETAPREEFIHMVLLARDHGNRCVMPAIFNGEEWTTYGIGGRMVFVGPTHWMPLPEPPALAAATGTAKIAKRAECEASQSGGCETAATPKTNDE